MACLGPISKDLEASDPRHGWQLAGQSPSVSTGASLGPISKDLWVSDPGPGWQLAG